MKYDPRLVQASIPPDELARLFPEAGDLRDIIKAGEQLENEDKLKKLMRLRLALDEKYPTLFTKDEKPSEEKAEMEGRKSRRDSEAVQHKKLLDALRTAVYDTDLNIPGRTNAIKNEVTEALEDLLKGGAYDDRKLAQVVEELFSLEGKSAAGTALAGRFASQEVPPADLPDDNSPDTTTADTSVAAVGTASSQDNDAAAKIVKKLTDAVQEEVIKPESTPAL